MFQCQKPVPTSKIKRFRKVEKIHLVNILCALDENLSVNGFNYKSIEFYFSQETKCEYTDFRSILVSISVNDIHH